MNKNEAKLITFIVDLSKVKIIYTHLGKYLKVSSPKYHVWKFPVLEEDYDYHKECSYLEIKENKYTIEITVPIDYYNNKKLYIFDSSR